MLGLITFKSPGIKLPCDANIVESRRLHKTFQKSHKFLLHENKRDRIALF